MEVFENEPFKLPFIPPHLRRLECEVSEFLKCCPDFERNVFLMMPFAQDPTRIAIYNAIESALNKTKFHCCRADQSHNLLDRLWDNVCTYMLGCQYGIAVYDSSSKTRFNPNVTVEAGFMLALGKQVLFLKDDSIRQIPTDLRGHNWASFNMLYLEASIERAVSNWVAAISKVPDQRVRHKRSQEARDLPGLISRFLGSYFKDDLPNNELQLLQAIKDIVSKAGFDSFTEQPYTDLTSRLRPYLSSKLLNTAIRVELCNSEEQIGEIIEETVSETRRYRTEFGDVVCVVYDKSSTYKKSFFRKDIGGLLGVHLAIAIPDGLET